MPFDSPFTAIRDRLRRNVRTLVETASVDNPSGTLAFGQFQFIPSFHGETATFNLVATMSVSKGSLTGSVQLYNVTDGEAVTNGLLQTSGTTPAEQVSAAFIVGSAAGNLKRTSKLYEIRMSVTGADVTDILSVGSVGLRVV